MRKSILLLVAVILLTITSCSNKPQVSAAPNSSNVPIPIESIPLPTSITPSSPQPSADIDEKTMYQAYYGVARDLIQEYGVCFRYGPAYYEEDFFAGETGLYGGSLCDFDSDGQEEMVCAYWTSYSNLYVRMYRFTDIGLQLLLEREVPDGGDNCRGISIPGKTSPYLHIFSDDISGFDTGIPQQTDYFYGIDGETLTTKTFSVIFSEGFGTGDPMPEHITSTYQIDGKGVDEKTYYEQLLTYFDTTAPYHIDEIQNATKALLTDLGEKAEVSDEDIAALLAAFPAQIQK